MPMIEVVAVPWHIRTAMCMYRGNFNGEFGNRDACDEREREREFVTVSADSAHRAAFDSVKKGKEKKNGKS